MLNSITNKSFTSFAQSHSITHYKFDCGSLANPTVNSPPTISPAKLFRTHVYVPSSLCARVRDRGGGVCEWEYIKINIFSPTQK